MISASQLRAGMAIRYEGQSYKVLAADYHPGQGKMGGANHVRLRNLATGTTWEHSLRAELKLDQLPVERRTLEFLYASGDTCVFMSPETFEQVEIEEALIGEPAKFLDVGSRVPVDFVDDRPVSVIFPDIIDVAIADTAPPLHTQGDGPWKPARLPNGLEVMVPPFVKIGDSIRLNVSEMRYMDRAKARAT